MYTHSCTYELVYPLTHRLSFNYVCKHFSNLYVYQSAIDQSSVIMYLVFLGDSDSKESDCNARDLSLIPVLGHPLEEKMATHSSILAGIIPWTEEPCAPQSTGPKELDTAKHTRTLLRFHSHKQEYWLLWAAPRARSTLGGTGTWFSMWKKASPLISSKTTEHQPYTKYCTLLWKLIKHFPSGTCHLVGSQKAFALSI